MNERVAYSSKKPKHRKRHWRDYNDNLWPAYNGLPSPQSLHPDARLSLEYVSGSQQARLIVAAWEPCLAWQSLIRVEVLP